MEVNRLFYVIYVKDESIRTLIDGIRFLADPKQKYQAHLTVRGPYKGKRAPKKFEGDWNTSIRNHDIHINGLGTFFNDSQNTVYLNCDGGEPLKSVWKKKDYKDYNPHITLYNGKDRKYAEQLKEVLNNFNLNFDLDVDELEVLKPPSVKNQLDLFDEPYVSAYLDKELLGKLLGHEIPEKVEDLAAEKRLDYIQKLGSILQKKGSSKMTANNTPPQSLGFIE